MPRLAHPTEPTGSTEHDLLLQSRALGDPTRHAVFAYLRDAHRAVGVAELTEHFRLNHNAIRQHLAKLVQAGLAVGERERPTGRGRPRWSYRALPGAAERWGGASPFETLSMLLVELLTGQRTPRDVGRRAGRRLAVEHGAEADAVVILEAVARRLGFEPRHEATTAGADVVLERCPFVGPASAAPDVVCELHLGIAEGIAEQGAGDVRVEGLLVRPPEQAGCRIAVRRAADAEADRSGGAVS